MNTRDVLLKKIEAISNVNKEISERICQKSYHTGFRYLVVTCTTKDEQTFSQQQLIQAQQPQVQQVGIDFPISYSFDLPLQRRRSLEFQQQHQHQQQPSTSSNFWRARPIHVQGNLPQPPQPQLPNLSQQQSSVLLQQSSVLLPQPSLLLPQLQQPLLPQLQQPLLPQPQRHIEISTKTKLEVVEKQSLTPVSQYIDKIPLPVLKPVRDIFKDKLDYSCKSFSEVISLNQKMALVAEQFGLLDAEKAVPYLEDFKRNFEEIQIYLGKVETLLPDSESQLWHLQQKVSQINSLISELYAEIDNLNGTNDE